jgi:hypothetical protein
VASLFPTTRERAGHFFGRAPTAVQFPARTPQTCTTIVRHFLNEQAFRPKTHFLTILGQFYFLPKPMFYEDLGVTKLAQRNRQSSVCP